MILDESKSNGDKLEIREFVTGNCNYCWITFTDADGNYTPFIVEKHKLREFLK